jgi:pectinesterase
MKKIPLIFAILMLLSFTPKPKSITIFTIGDSTMANKTTPVDHPAERGWGMMLPEFFKPTVTIQNHAKNGRSSKSFRTEGRWTKVLEQIKRGDYVFIQFGHNDQKTDTLRYTDPETTYKANLIRYINETRERGGIPVLFTSIARRTFNADGTLNDTHGAYIDVVKQVAAEQHVICIDLNTATHKLVQSLGDESSKALYMWVDDRKDNTHLNEKGARMIAKMAVDSIRFEIPGLTKYFR